MTTTSATAPTSTAASIVKTLGSGSGLDINALVTTLVAAQFAAKTQSLAKREETLTAQISGISELRSSITSFDAALGTLVTGGTLRSTIASSNAGALTATALPGADLSNFSASVGVVQLASAQVVSINTPVDRTATWQRGTLTLRIGRDVVDSSGAVTGFTQIGSSVAISITNTDTTLDGIAAKINATPGVSAAGVVASVIDDGTGARLVLRGPMGGDKAFELGVSGTNGGGLSLSNLAVSRTSTTTTAGTRARDAIVQMDGVRYTRASNTIGDIAPGVTLNLLAPTTTDVALSMQRPTAALTSAVNDFVAAFNEVMAIVKAQTDPFTGVLRGDPATAALTRGLARLTTAPLNTSAGATVRTLADLGVATARDGTLSVDAARLSAALARDPQGVETIFASGGGLRTALSDIARAATQPNTGLSAAASLYTREVGRIDEAQADLAVATEAARERLTRRFSAMDTRVAAYKSTQDFLKQQVDAWYKA